LYEKIGILNKSGEIMSTDKAPALPKAMGKVAGEEAFLYSIDFDENSKLAKHLSRRKKRPVTELRWSDLEIGKLLGEGNFSHVYEVRLIFRDDLPDTGTVTTGSETISDDVWNSRSDAWKNPNVKEEADIWDLVSSPDAIDSDSYYSDEEKDKTTYQDRCISESKVRERVYALKHLHPDVTRRQQKFTASAIDLVLEAKILSCLDHPNIVKLFGVTEGSINKAFTDHGYFLLLDRLHLTLEDKIKEWTSMEAMAAITLSIASASERRALMQRRKFSVSKSKRRFETPPTSSETSLSSKDRSAMLKEKIGNVAISIARGMEYLHSHQIIFRDLKVGGNLTAIKFKYKISHPISYDFFEFSHQM
jgi:serine/threonine protein kinase